VGKSATSAPASPAIKQQFPFLDLKAQFAGIRGEVMESVTRVMESQHFILGPEVAAFEQEVGALIGCDFALGCASGSDALLLALMALDVGPGDEVITPAFTFVATAGSVARLRAKPVFMDVDPETYNIDAKQLAKLITPRTKAIIPVHLFGLAADMDAIMSTARERGIAVIEDAAQAIGAQYKGRRVGSIGTFGCFSFFPSKNLGGAGDGGLITTNDPVLADTLKVLRVHGSRSKYEYEKLGMNSRLDALQAAILRVKLKHLESWAEGRRRNADRYRELFAEYDLLSRITLPKATADAVHVYNQFTIRVRARDALKKHLQQSGIPTEIYYPHPLHLQPAFRGLGHERGSLPFTEAVAQEVLSLPIFPELTAGQQRAVVAAIADFYRKPDA
jgi:dTDP-4-amino-4,6-dideoxygalactose transaminase